MTVPPKFRIAALLLAATLLTGCSSELKTYPVSGKVKFEDGSPAMFGVIELQSSSRKINARGKIQRDGSFVLGTHKDGDGAIEGKHKVVITQLFANQFNLDVIHDHGALVHEKYGSYRTSDLTITVKPEKDGNEVVLTVEKRSQ